MSLSTLERPSEASLLRLVQAHYDNPWLMRLTGEIHFDDALSEADIAVAAVLLEQATGMPLRGALFLPCAGTLRHVPPLLRRGVERVVAVDLSAESLAAGRRHYQERINSNVEVHHADIRHAAVYAPDGGFLHAILMANSLGDVVEVEGHMAFIQALAEALAPGGALVFDYIGDRYNPPVGALVDTEWPEMLRQGDETRRVYDRRTRWFEPWSDGVGALRCSCELRDEAGEVLDRHEYARLTVRDDVLCDQFQACGLELRSAGRMVDLSPYHRRRVETANDLGMVGEPDHVFVAVKRR